ncbi:MAG: response regulator [Elusimicrobia bacterium]|nr:response regulator [Elusimicrobiota bacterium]
MTEKEKILLVEDEDDLARLFELALAREGFRIRRARDGSAALDVFRRWSPDLILLDVVLPGMSGFDFLEQLRQESRVAVILLSGRRRPVDVALGARLGADDYLVKPFALEELRSRVKLALSRADGRAAPAARKNSPARRRAARSVPR